MVKVPGAGRAVGALLSPMLLAGAKGGAGVLQDKLTGPGSGIHHPGLPNRSSAEGEYPASQSEQLRDAVGARRRSEGIGSEFGVIDGPDYTADLHFRDPSSGGRPFMDDAKYDRDVWRGIFAGVRLAAAGRAP